MTHRDAVVDTDGVELERDSAGGAYRLLDDASEFLEVSVTGDDVHVRVADRDERLVEITALANLTGGAQQTAMRCALESLFDGIGAHYDRSLFVGGMKDIEKEKGLVPSSRERPFVATERLSRCGKRRPVCVTSLSEQVSSQSR